MRYEIYKKTKIANKVWRIKSEDIKIGQEGIYEQGIISKKALNKTRFNPIISKIPESKMTELNKTGKTAFTVVTTQTVVLTK
ncbi:hypothetical protein [Chryseobacterium binzhouense]|uniref:hypothetical protein n=1 Tax=Chryseobacterium binzhouense TaxID=2593646 RepID=UPI00289814FC|nr:hypothetical protein [Chryseobacterium binzhouense]